MIVFETERLVIKRLELLDKEKFTTLLTDPKILDLIPQKPFTEAQVSERFFENLQVKRSDLTEKKCVCGIFEKGNPELIGLALFLINENNENELGYRFRVEAWGKGYGTETTQGMLDYYFTILKVDKVTADVNIENLGSVKILSKFMKPVKEFFNTRDQCTDRRYEIKRYSYLEKP